MEVVQTELREDKEAREIQDGERKEEEEERAAQSRRTRDLQYAETSGAAHEGGTNSSNVHRSQAIAGRRRCWRKGERRVRGWQRSIERQTA
eukprot:755487-Hanusia_phi.AAC.1